MNANGANSESIELTPEFMQRLIRELAYYTNKEGEIRIAYIKFNGKSSEEIDLILENDMHHVSSVYDVDTVEIAGRDGALLVDNQRLKAVEQAFPLL